ncbi:MAG: hypothetical protein HC923_12415 [Myxococcales bacterium]|nr:hypothetical protein [Myxococcales bacterium]
MTATVTDAWGVQKVTFVMYSRLQDDGTIPPDALKADGVRRKRREAVEAAQTLVAGNFIDQFGDPLADNPRCRLATLDNAMIDYPST